MTTPRDPRAARLAHLAALVADGTRAVCLLALLDGRAWTAGELARYAGVAPSTLTGHLDRLVTGGLLAEERQGRHRYVRLAGPRAAQLVEELAAWSGPADLPRRGGLRAATADSAMARARTCYDHLAGRLGIALTDALADRGLLLRETGFALTGAGLEWFAANGIALDPGGRRPLARACLDWTERRPHLAGAAGAALCRHALETGWCARIGSERAVRVTAAGERALRDLLGVPPDALR
ncbi:MULTISPECIES: ArsR/SmtB family transcription factor [Streptomyces]|uniref:Helix-turn-helix domain-containing protein n=1 Tax=Streptomyces doudnae TaxID=3075536 RepID=A0ABD5ETM3_9ACTN|nr:MULTISPECIES: helix-turn-helix domain-containing protein [unclassified Streptomyces]MDT0437547.1 helix-turn-helix domain-containing protein [Streptomyces sp. DSM 41981]MYQ65667.1 transcriptional regulator [Streptomyces sp. SID4950]SCE05092.1 DNA-binding transcriptional regulator, ArsR family [Streptomyces sp. SolWspMP-5a-2]